MGDLSFIDSDHNISNGNVLYETGVADAFLGEERVILVCDENTIIENIAFDINHKRISRVNTKKDKSKIISWIRAGLEESDKQRYIKTYATNQYEEDLLILLNYFYRYINMTKNLYEGTFYIPSIDNIISEFNKAKFPLFFLNTDFNDFINQLEEKLLRLNQFSHKRTVWNIINIITKLREYQKFCMQTKYSFIKIIDEKKQYNVYDTNNFFLKSVEDFSFDRKTVLFLNNSEIINGENGFYVMDKRILKKNNSNYDEKFVETTYGVQKVIMNKLAKISSDAIPNVAYLVSNILRALEEYLNYCDLKISFEGNQALLIIE